MNAFVLEKLKSDLVLKERDPLQPGAGEVVVRLAAAALNRRDFWITQGMYPDIELPIVLGSDGAGTISRLGAGVSDRWKNQSVVINPGWNWGNDPAVQSDDFQILGLPHDGTFAEEVVVPENALHARPEHLDVQHAAALPLAGVTAYRALFTQGQLAAGDNVLVTGAGGGVATFAIQFAIAAGARVWVTSSSSEKIEQAVKLGAEAGFKYTDKTWSKQLRSAAGSVNLIIDSAGGKGYEDLLKIAAPGARIVNYGATTGPPREIDLFKLFWKQLKLVGTTMGSPGDFAAMIDFVSRHKIKPVVESVVPLAEVNDSLNRMKSSNQFGKLVLEV